MPNSINTIAAVGLMARPLRWLARIGWFAALWAASVLALAVVALIFRALMTVAGLTAG